MADPHGFAHLRLLFREHGSARFPPAPQSNADTDAAKKDRSTHATTLSGSAATVSQSWNRVQATRATDAKPPLPVGIPLLLKIDPGLDIDELTGKLGFEIVSEEKDGYVMVASRDIQLQALLQKLDEFSKDVRGSGVVASVHEIDSDPSQDARLRRVLSEDLYAAWTTLDENQEYVCDVGISCSGDWLLPKRPTRNQRWKQSTWARKEAEWAAKRSKAYDDWEVLQSERLALIREFGNAYEGRIEGIVEDVDAENEAAIPDSFTVRLRIVARGLKDLVLNCAYVFEAVEPDDIETPQGAAVTESETMQAIVFSPPPADAPAICVIDSGIQEGHFWLTEAIDSDTSTTYLDEAAPSVADRVANGGHGTRVAGAILYGDSIPDSGSVTLPFWIQNARVLDHECCMPDQMFPPELMRRIVTQYSQGTRSTRVFNHSINAASPCRTRHMSAWAAEIDRLSFKYDILVVQSVGNIPLDHPAPMLGVTQLLAGGKTYPEYLDEPVCRLANPSQSLQALTVGSVALEVYESAGWATLVTSPGMPSAFTRSGLGIWGAVKPEVVEFGGDALRDTGNPPRVATPDVANACYPALLRSTVDGGPAVSRDGRGVGSSFAAPRVARIAAAAQAVLPKQSALLYRALVVQSARWPTWSDALGADERAALLRRIGYGVPDLERATVNTDYRTTFITDGDSEIGPGDCHIYQVRLPEDLRRAGTDFDVRIDATLSYAAEPRRTRRRHRAYLSTWVDWISSRKEERVDAFLTRALRLDEEIDEGGSFGWSLENRGQWGSIPDARRSVGTVQKDWAIVKSNQLPRDLCFAVRGHRGWSKDPDAIARYVFAVTVDVVGQELPIYEPLRTAVQELEVELGVESEIEVEIEDGGE